METTRCQLHELPSMHEPLGKVEMARQFFQHRLKRMLKRRGNFLMNILREAKPSQDIPDHGEASFLPHEQVRIKSAADVHSTLDRWNELQGCGFMEEMWKYCGTEQTIFKRVERFLDERDYRIKRVRNIYILDGLICGGTVDFGPCDRSCFFFWHEAWLQKTNEGA